MGKYLIFFILNFKVLLAQNKLHLSCNEKIWAITHIFVAVKALKYTKEVMNIVDSLKVIKKFTDINSYDGGKLDAFRHSFWMAYLALHIKTKKVLKLGIAHEKGNIKDFKKKRKEEKFLPDSISVAMDLFNNKKGIEIINSGYSIKNKNDLINIIIDYINKGEMKVILKDKYGNFLDCNGNILNKESWQGKWINKRCLVNSNSY